MIGPAVTGSVGTEVGKLQDMVQQLHPILSQSTSNLSNGPIEHTSSGMIPVRPGLFDKIRVVNANNPPISLGMEPDSLFEERDRNSEMHGIL